MLVSLLGAVLAAPIVSRPLLSAGRHRSGFAVVALGVVVLAVTIGDVRSIVHMDPRGLPTIEERAAVEQLSVLAPDCPVAQLPVGSFPDYPMADGSPTALSYYYRGFVPYLLNPEGTWSFGAVKGSASDHALRSLPPTLTGPVLMQLRQAGYCAVLYDTHYAQWMRAKNLKWPAQDIVGLTPAWQDDRFAVFSLRQS